MHENEVFWSCWLSIVQIKGMLHAVHDIVVGPELSPFHAIP
jgi:hypothetical protein